MADAPPLATVLNAWHRAHGGRMVEFGGWTMPVQYTTIVEEHRAVREGVGLFDISHMGRLRFDGPDAAAWLDFVTTYPASRMAPGEVRYALILNERGGVRDDVLIYRMGDGGYRMVCNASNRPKVLDHLEAHRVGRDAAAIDLTLGSAMIAVQGPAAREVVGRVFDGDLEGVGYYRLIEGRITAGAAAGSQAVASRTGYTGEDGFELIVAADAAVPTWEALLEAGADRQIRPCGLGARDTLRFEAGMPLYGHELSEEIDPFEAGLGRVVRLDRGDFVGRDALLARKDSPDRSRVGLALEGKRIARQGCAVRRDGRDVGVVTSGTFAPTLNGSYAMALVEAPAATPGTALSVDVRGHDEPARVVELPFYRRAKTVGSRAG